ncbi:MAG TPA: DUF2309 domain-containing protein [Nitrospiraceae bacterium]|nr:DUF2309 domain-containing protein [Nitrospiraceae bacterium]
MTTRGSHGFTDAQRMELRSYVQLAGEVISPYWPMRTFIHHNPLHGLEILPFEQAVERGAQVFGGRGYLSNDTYRAYLQSGRICVEDVRAALRPLVSDKQAAFAGRSVSHLDVLAASMIHGVTEPAPQGRRGEDEDDRDTVAKVASWLLATSVMQGIRARFPSTPENADALATRETLSAWCDWTVGSTIAEIINREMTTWCAAFLDEGEASWSMPYRERTFYLAWKTLAQHDAALRLIGIRHAARKIRALPDRPEDAILESLTHLKLPKAAWEAYLTLHLAALPGWTGYIKWRANQTGFPWQEQYPVDLVNYLAVRLFYERELVEWICRDRLGLPGDYEEIRRFIDQHPHACWLRREWVAGRLSGAEFACVRRLARSRRRHDQTAWEDEGRRQYERRLEQETRNAPQAAARSLVRLARALSIDPDAIESTPPSDVRTVLDWLDGFPPSEHGRHWLEAFEASHRRDMLDRLAAAARRSSAAAPVPDQDPPSRPLAQVVFCIDVRSEVFRRHLEHRGGYETLGLAGFFGVPLDYQPFNASYAVSHCPVLLKPKNRVREVPRSYHGAVAERHKTAARLSEAAHALLHDLKGNVVTPYVMVEALGWFFSLPLFGKTLLPVWYEAASRWVKRLLIPSVATTLTVEKLTREEAEEMVAAEQQARIRELLRERFGLTGAALSPALLDKIRKKALGQANGPDGEVASVLRLTPEEEEAFYRELREHHRISPRGISERLQRITQTGFTITEQAYYVEAALRLTGLSSNFARVVLFCAHGSTSDNNPYESALDCGACGGNQGLSNARVIAAMANKPAVRELLQARGIAIPSDTHFFAAQHDTTADTVRIVDLEDVPATHRKDLQRLMEDLEEAGARTALERGRALDGPTAPLDPWAARRQAQRRSRDWAEVRPEWGLSRNSLMIIGRRALSQPVDLQGRAFLHSYDHRQDASGKLLETIMTAPLVVAQWINMEHYFSTVDNEVYGSGSKVYHNVVGRIGVMTGVWSDLRIGLPAQTVLSGRLPYHEPMRLLAVIEAPRERITAIIDRHPLLKQLFNLGWVALAALDPRDGEFHHYDRAGGWIRRGAHHDRLDVASDEGNQDRRAGRTLEICH